MAITETEGNHAYLVLIRENSASIVDSCDYVMWSGTDFESTPINVSRLYGTLDVVLVQDGVLGAHKRNVNAEAFAKDGAGFEAARVADYELYNNVLVGARSAYGGLMGMTKDAARVLIKIYDLVTNSNEHISEEDATEEQKEEELTWRQVEKRVKELRAGFQSLLHSGVSMKGSDDDESSSESDESSSSDSDETSSAESDLEDLLLSHPSLLDGTIEKLTKKLEEKKAELKRKAMFEKIDKEKAEKEAKEKAEKEKEEEKEKAEAVEEEVRKKRTAEEREEEKEKEEEEKPVPAVQPPKKRTRKAAKKGKGR